MLRELRIENLLLIERAELRLDEGFNVITGETGAGKTILAHSLDLLMGGRARPQIVRPGAGEAWVEGTFDLPPDLAADPALAEIAQRLPEDAEELVLGRRVSASGRTAAFIGGRSAAAGDLRLLGARLLAFYGQHEHRKLVLASAQLETLDGFAGEAHRKTLAAYREAHSEVQRTQRELAQLREMEGARERDLDLLRFELSEIEAAAPDAGEEAELAAERSRLGHAEGLRLAAQGALAALAGADEDGGGASGALAAAEGSLGGARGVDPGLDRVDERVASLALEAADVAAELRGYLERIEADPTRLMAVEERLEALDRLKRKHGGSVESVLAHAERCRTELERLENAEGRGAELESELSAAGSRRAELAAKLSTGRRRAARRLDKRVAAELEELAMPAAAFAVELDAIPEGFGPNGAEAVTFMLATNPGIEPAPLRDAASGGELSRVMLALTGLGSGSVEATLCFDEIDAGVGGNTARRVGERLREIAERRQVICITHLPQVASLASGHFRISKRVAKGEALASVQRVDGDELVAEICRMLGADSGDEAASRHAQELLAAAA
jgi:DNA repair protein RecN (Recombination protein N)